jgi:hypothetical protein
MSNFQSNCEIKRVRKPHTCEHCGLQIATRRPASVSKGRYDGHFYAFYTHPDCWQAGSALADENGDWGEDFVWLHQINEYNDARFIINRFPAVATRLSICGRVAELDTKTACSPTIRER